MKHARLLLAVFLWVTLPIFAATQTDVIIDLKDPQFNVGDYAARKLTVQGVGFPLGVSNSVVLGAPLNVTTDSNGSVTLSNLQVAAYDVTVKAPPLAQKFTFGVTATNLGTIYAGANLIVSTNMAYPSGGYSWSIAASDARYATIGSGGGSATATNLAADLSATNLSLYSPTFVGGLGVLTNPVVELSDSSRLEFTNNGAGFSYMMFSEPAEPSHRQGIFFSGGSLADGGIWYWPNHGGDALTAPELLLTSRGSMAFSSGNLGGAASGAASRGFQFGIGGAWHNWMYMQADAPGSTLIDGGNTNYAMSIPILFKGQYWSNSAWGTIGSSGADTLTGSFMPGMVGRATGTNGDGAISFYDKFSTGYDTWGSSAEPRFEVRVSPDTERGGISINGGITINGATGLTTNYALSGGDTMSYSNGVLVAVSPWVWDDDIVAYLARINTSTNTLLACYLNSFANSLKADGTWTNLQVLYTFTGANADTNGQNLISTSHTIEWSGTWGTNDATGIHGNGSDAYGNTTFTNVTTNGSAFAFVVANGNGSGKALFGVQKDSGFDAKSIYVYDQNAAYGLGRFSSYANGTLWYPTWPSSVMVERDGGNLGLFSGGSETGVTSAVAVTGPADTRPIYIGAMNNQGTAAYFSAAYFQGFAFTTNVLSGDQYKTLHDAFVVLNTHRSEDLTAEWVSTEAVNYITNGQAGVVLDGLQLYSSSGNAVITNNSGVMQFDSGTGTKATYADGDWLVTELFATNGITSYGDITLSGTISGDGSGLTNLSAAAISGVLTQGQSTAVTLSNALTVVGTNYVTKLAVGASDPGAATLVVENADAVVRVGRTSGGTKNGNVRFGYELSNDRYVGISFYDGTTRESGYFWDTTSHNLLLDSIGSIGFRNQSFGGTTTFLVNNAGNATVSGSLTATNGVVLPATATPPTLGIGGAQLWSDGTNLCVIIKDGGGTLTTNKLTMSAWP